ncbi:MAG: hypothetical protein ABIH70_00305 [Chloroflexota bacterium]
MLELKTAITIVELIVGVAAVTVIGDYLGHKIGRWRLASIMGILVLIAIAAFAIYAALVLT